MIQILKTSWCIALCALCMTGFAQEDVGGTGTLAYGAKAGVGTSSLGDAGTTYSYEAGGFVKYGLNDLMAVGGEVLYRLSGGAINKDYSRYAPPTTLNYQNRSLELQSVSVPVWVSYSLGTSGTISPGVYLGGAYDYIFAAHEVFDKVFIQPDATTSMILLGQRENVGSNYEQHRFSALAGFFVDIPTDKFVITPEIRYYHTINDISLQGAPLPQATTTTPITGIAGIVKPQSLMFGVKVQF